MTSTAPQSRFNPFSPENLLNPSQFDRELRENDPVHWSEVMQGWLITRYDDVVNCFRDSRLSANRTKFFEYQLQGKAGVELITDLIESFNKQMLMKDGAEHLRLRRQSNPAFSPLALDAWRPAIRRITDELVSKVQPLGRMDLAKEISYHLPTMVIAEVLGVPSEDRKLFQRWGEEITLFAGGASGDVVEKAHQANQAVRNISRYLTENIEKRRLAPGHDMLSQLIQVQEGGNMAVDELVSNSLLVLTAGHVTTTDQITSGMYDLLTHPDQLQLLRENPSLIKSAVEEMVRYSPPTCFTHRIVTETFQLRGRTLRKGEVVLLGLASANRDPAVFPDPDRFDITRDHVTQKHLGFAFGPHHCLGAGLARRELEITFEILLERLPELRLDEEQPAQRKPPTILFRSFESLPVRW